MKSNCMEKPRDEIASMRERETGKIEISPIRVLFGLKKEECAL